MKFITILAAALASGFAFGACSYAPAKETAWVYKWKFTGKTTNPKQTTQKAKYSACSAAPQVCAVRVPASLKIQGWTWACNPGCGDQFAEIVETDEMFWVKKPSKYSLSGGVSTEVFHVIGKKADKAELAGTAKFDGPAAMYRFTYAGLGKYDKKNSRLKSASGSFAGTFDPCECDSSAVWETCGGLSLCCDSNPTSIVYGKWSVKYNKSAAKKFLKNGRLPKYPSWASHVNAE